MRKTTRFLSLASLAALLAGCGHMVHGTGQSIEVQAAGLPAGVTASCSLQNERAAWVIPVTPGTVSVDRSSTRLEVDCRSTTGWVGRTVVRAGASQYSLSGNIGVGAFTVGTLAPTSAAITSAATANAHTLWYSAAASGIATGGAVAGVGLAAAGASTVVDLHGGGAFRYPQRIRVEMRPTDAAITIVPNAEVSPYLGPVATSRPAAPRRSARPAARRSSAGLATK